MMYFLLESRKYLSDLLPLINRKDIRSARKWCLKNHLFIYKDSSGEFVNEREFELTYNLPVISKLKEQYNENWRDYYNLYQTGKLHEGLLKSPSSTHQKRNYNPKGKLSAKIFGESRK